MKLVDKGVEAIKLAYLSNTAIVWLVCPEKETLNKVIIEFVKEHFGEFRGGIGNAVNISALTEDSILHYADSPKIFYQWIGGLGSTEHPSDKAHTLSRNLEIFISMHLCLETEEIFRQHETDRNLFEHSMVIIASPFSPNGGWFNRYIKIIHIDTLNDDEIHSIIESFTSQEGVFIDESFLNQLIVSFRGISEREINQVLSRCLVSELFDIFDSESKEKIFAEIHSLKRQMLEGFKGLKWIKIDSNVTPATGLAAITSWLEKRKNIFSDPEKKQKEGYDVPKGLLVTGIPGTGKSLMAKDASRILNLPLIAMDLGDIQEGIVGKSEEHMAAALRMVDVMAPCVLWIDEIEKAFSGANSGQSDGGVMRRMFGKFLTWMQEKTSFCFVFATSNDISKLPPELFRSERFDEKFYNFMPSASECAEIFVANIKYHNDKFKHENGKTQLLFDGIFEHSEFWLDFLNKKCLEINKEEYGKFVEMSGNYWRTGYVPQKKLFTGADISSFVKNLKFYLLDNRRKDSHMRKGPFTKVEVEGVISEVLSVFMPYGQTNLNDIARCFFVLAKNRFRSASQLNFNDSIIRFDKFSEETGVMQYEDNRFTGENNAYNKVLYAAIVGAINNMSRKIQKNKKVHED